MKLPGRLWLDECNEHTYLLTKCRAKLLKMRTIGKEVGFCNGVTHNFLADSEGSYGWK